MLQRAIGAVFSSKKVFLFVGGLIAFTQIMPMIQWHTRDTGYDTYNTIAPGTELDFKLYYAFDRSKLGRVWISEENLLWNATKVPYLKRKPLLNHTYQIPMTPEVRKDKAKVYLVLRVSESDCVSTKTRKCLNLESKQNIVNWKKPSKRVPHSLLEGATPTPTPAPYAYRYRTMRFDLLYEDRPVNWQMISMGTRYCEIDKRKRTFTPSLTYDDVFDIRSERRRIITENDNFSLGVEVNIRGYFLFNLKETVKYSVSMNKFLKDQWGEILRIFINANPILLWTTIIASILHSIFQILAFEKDLQFWRKKKTFHGVSLRTIVLQFIGQAILFLNLIDSGSKIPIYVKVLDFAGLALQVSKIFKMVQFTLKFPFIKVRDECKGDTDDADAAGMRYLYWGLVPLIIGYSVYQLKNGQYVNVKSYVVHCASGAVYAFGFLAMLPQLYVNYKLKTVAGMSRSALVYKFITTFIDDLWTFVSDLPLMYKIACFRDDVIFIIWIFQCFIYPVDPLRVNEFGMVEKEAEEEEEKEEQQKLKAE